MLQACLGPCTKWMGDTGFQGEYLRFFAAVKGSELINDTHDFIMQEGLMPATEFLTPCHVRHMLMCLLWLQGVEPEARTLYTIIIACNLYMQPLQSLGKLLCSLDLGSDNMLYSCVCVHTSTS